MWGFIKNIAGAVWNGIKEAAKAVWGFVSRNSKAILNISKSVAVLVKADKKPRYGVRTTVVREHYRVNPDGNVSKVRAHVRSTDSGYPYAGGAFRYRPRWEF